MKKLFCVLCLFAGLASAAFASEKQKLVVGASPFPHKEILLAAKPALEKEGYTLEIIEFADYVLPNVALAEKNLDANFFQHIPYLENMNKAKDLNLVWIAKVHIEPMGLYSKKVTSLDALKKGDTIAVPNDPTNGARALRLLEKHGLFTFKEGALITIKDVVENPKGLKLVSLDAAQLPRTLNDVTASVINTNFASEAGLIPTKDAIIMEDKDSPYTNVLVVRAEDKDSPKAKALAKAINAPEVREFIVKKLEPRGITPAF